MPTAGEAPWPSPRRWRPRSGRRPRVGNGKLALPTCQRVQESCLNSRGKVKPATRWLPTQAWRAAVVRREPGQWGSLKEEEVVWPSVAAVASPVPLRLPAKPGNHRLRRQAGGKPGQGQVWSGGQPRRERIRQADRGFSESRNWDKIRHDL